MPLSTHMEATKRGKTLAQLAEIKEEFDGLVEWISPSVLYNRMVAAGRLP